MEEWRTIRGFPGYRVSSEGQIDSCKDYHGNLTNNYRTLRPRINNNGYHIVTLYDENGTPHQLAVHRLVAMTFIPNADVSLYVDHIDCDKTNNSVSNLEFVTPRENSIRAMRNGLYEPIFAMTRRPVIATDIRNGDELYFIGVNEAARQLGYSPAIISRAANMLVDKVGIYRFEFADRDDRLLHHDFN